MGTQSMGSRQRGARQTQETVVTVPGVREPSPKDFRPEGKFQCVSKHVLNPKGVPKSFCLRTGCWKWGRHGMEMPTGPAHPGRSPHTPGTTPRAPRASRKEPCRAVPSYRGEQVWGHLPRVPSQDFSGGLCRAQGRFRAAHASPEGCGQVGRLCLETHGRGLFGWPGRHSPSPVRPGGQWPQGQGIRHGHRGGQGGWGPEPPALQDLLRLLAVRLHVV